MIMKKIFLLILCFVLSFTLFACGQVNEEERAINDKAGTVAELTLYSFDGKSESVFAIPVLGHAFVALKNTSENTISVYGFEITPGTEVTIGSWGQSAWFGIWFNVESYYMSLGRYRGIVSLSQNITLDDLDKMTQYMAGNDVWTPSKNCSFFAVSLWNLAENGNEIDDINGLTTPEKLANSIKQFNSCLIQRPSQTPDGVSYKKDGEFVFCPPA